MTESERNLLHEIAIDEFRKRRLFGSVWLVGMLAVVSFTVYGIYKTFLG
jgi:hypothetical protein